MRNIERLARMSKELAQRCLEEADYASMGIRQLTQWAIALAEIIERQDLEPWRSMASTAENNLQVVLGLLVEYSEEYPGNILVFHSCSTVQKHLDAYMEKQAGSNLPVIDDETVERVLRLVK